jgi:hypothetical protein
MPRFAPDRLAFVRSWFAPGERLYFGLLVLLHLVPVWTCAYFLTLDGPSHVYNAWLWKTLLLNPQHPFHQYVTFNLQPEPNFLSHVLLAAAMTVLSPAAADKVVLTLYVAGLPLAMRYLLRAWQPAAGFLAVLVLPFVYSMVLQFGFYNFCLSLVLLLVVLGYWRRHVAFPQERGRRTLGLALWVTGLYFAHPLTYLVAGLVLGLFALEQVLADGRRDGSDGQFSRLLRELGTLLAAFAPTLGLLGWYLLRQGATGPAPPAATDVGAHVVDWVLLEPLRIMGTAEGTYRGLVAGLLGGLLLYALVQHLGRRAVARAGAWALAVGGLAGAYVAMPDAMAGGSIVPPRLGLCSYLLLIGLLGTVVYPRRLRLFIAVVGGSVAVLLLGFRYGRYQTLATGLDEYLSAAPYLRPGATLAALTYGHITRMPNGKRFDSYVHSFPYAAGYLGVERGVFNFENYEASTGYFPLRWRPGAKLLSTSDETPSALDLSAVPRSRWPDYVLLWARKTQAVPTANARVVAAQLESAYRLAYRSATGLLELYERTPERTPGDRPTKEASK